MIGPKNLLQYLLKSCPGKQLLHIYLMGAWMIGKTEKQTRKGQPHWWWKKDNTDQSRDTFFPLWVLLNGLTNSLLRSCWELWHDLHWICFINYCMGFIRLRINKVLLKIDSEVRQLQSVISIKILVVEKDTMLLWYISIVC